MIGKTRIFPIMQVIGIRRALAEAHPWLPMAVCKAFAESKSVALAHLLDTSTTKIRLPFDKEQLRQATTMMGADFWRYGMAANRHALEHLVEAHHRQGLSDRKVGVDKLFHKSPLENYVI